MVVVAEAAGALTLVSRLARPRVLAVLATALLIPAALLARRHPLAGGLLAAAAALLVILGGRATRAVLGAGRVTVRPASLFERGATRPLATFVRVGVETVGEARARRAAEHARRFQDRSGRVMPGWMQPPARPGVNDHLRRIVLVAQDGEPLPVTAWLAAEDDLEPACAALRARLG